MAAVSGRSYSPSNSGKRRYCRGDATISRARKLNSDSNIGQPSYPSSSADADNAKMWL
jgi:hypothetical protein